MSLIKLEVGPELAGLLLPLLALPAAWAMRRLPRIGARLAVLAYIAIYALVWYPPTTPVQTILLAGTGVAIALALAAHALSGPHGPRIDGYLAIANAIIAYAVLRAANHSLDLYMAGSLWGLLPILGLLPLLLLEGVWHQIPPTPSERGGALLPSLALFAHLTLIFLAISCPDSVSAWFVTHDETISNFYLLAFAFVIMAFSRDIAIVRLFGSTLCFSALIALIYFVRVDFPTAAGQTVSISQDPGATGFVLTLAFWLSTPMVMMSAGNLMPMLTGRSPLQLLASLVAGLYFLVFIALLLTFTNVWGYVEPISPLLRNQFSLPFMLCALVALLPLPFLWKKGYGTTRSLAEPMFVIYIVVLTAFGGWSKPDIPTPDPSKNTFTVLTYNYQQGSRADGDQAYVAQCDFIRRVNPDIVALQESDTARPSGGFVNSAKYFADTLGYHLYYGPTSVAGTFGTAILSRFPMRYGRTIYTYSDVDEVGTAVVDLKIGDKLVTLYNNHPAGSDTVMNAHADMLVKEIQHGGPVIAAGDFNSRPDEAPYKAIAATLNDSWATLHPTGKGPGYNLNTNAPKGEIDMTRRIDHIFVSEHFEVVSTHYILPPDSVTDHPAHWAVLRWKVGN
jgi:endonuclease/exonuclease/phosphatase family metal-dependent hydrolase